MDKRESEILTAAIIGLILLTFAIYFLVSDTFQDKTAGYCTRMMKEFAGSVSDNIDIHGFCSCMSKAYAPNAALDDDIMDGCLDKYMQGPALEQCNSLQSAFHDGINCDCYFDHFKDVFIKNLKGVYADKAYSDAELKEDEKFDQCLH